MERKTIFTGLICVMTAMLCESAFAYSPVGPPKAGLKAGHFSYGFDYSHSDFKFEKIWTSDFVAGTLSEEIEEGTADSYSGKIGYGLFDGLEIYSFFGTTDNTDEFEDENFAGGNDFKGGGGIKLTLFDAETISWGIVAQISWTEGEDSNEIDLTGLGFGVEEVQADFGTLDVFVAFGATIQTGNLIVYGGPALFYHDLGIDVEYEGVTILESNSDEAQFGGYGGVGLDLFDNCTIYGEYMFTDDIWAFGTGIVWKF